MFTNCSQIGVDIFRDVGATRDFCVGVWVVGFPFSLEIGLGDVGVLSRGCVRIWRMGASPSLLGLGWGMWVWLFCTYPQYWADFLFVLDLWDFLCYNGVVTERPSQTKNGEFYVFFKKTIDAYAVTRLPFAINN